jgi:hypothetical protein
MSAASSADASPPTFPRNDVSMYMNSHAVVEAVVIKSKRWSKGAVTHNTACFGYILQIRS